MSVSGAYLVAGAGVSRAQSAPAGAAPGGTLRIGTTAPARALDPLTIGDTGASILVGQTAEYLALSTGEPELRPVLAESWSPNDDDSVWTFKIRQGVRFHDGRPLTARDVAASFNFAADPANGTNALEAWEGILRWHEVLLYPAGSDPDQLQVSARVRLPMGWQHGTALMPGGRLGIVNYTPGEGGPGPAPGEGVRVERAAVIADAQAAGLRVLDAQDLPYHYLLVLGR